MAKMSDGGKGSTPRPYTVSQDQFATNWDNIFKKDSETKEKLQKALKDANADEQERLSLYKSK